MTLVEIRCKRPGCGNLLASLGPELMTTEDEYIDVPWCWRCAKADGTYLRRDFLAWARLRQHRGEAAPFTVPLAHRVVIADLRSEVTEAARLPVKVPL